MLRLSRLFGVTNGRQVVDTALVVYRMCPKAAVKTDI